MINSSDVVRTTFITLVIAWCIYLGFLIFEFFQVVIFMFLTVPFIWSLFHLVYLLCHWILSVRNPGKDPVKSFLIPAAGIVMFFSTVFFAIFLPNFLGARGSEQLAACESNIKNIATDLEMYGTDNKGDYPPSLEYLIKNTDSAPDSSYMKSLPLCPSCRLKYSYSVNNNIPTFTIWCTAKSSHIYAGLPNNECYPQYTPGRGLIVEY